MNRINLDLEPSIVPYPVNHGGVSKSFTYINNTGVPVYVTEPSGGHVVVNPEERSVSLQGIVVYVTYRVRYRGGNLTGLLDAVNAKLKPQLENDLKSRGECTLMYVVDDVTALLYGELLVVQKLGLAFSIAPVQLDNTPIKTSMRNNHALVLGVVVVQRHDDQRSLRWVRYYTTLVQVEPMRSKFYEPGVYMIIREAECVEGGKGIMFGFDDLISPFRVFEDEAAARAFEWRNAIPEVAALKTELQQKIAVVQEEHDRRKNTLELEHKLRLQELAIDKEQTSAYWRERENQEKLRVEKRKDHYESRSFVRKDGSESLKAIPAFITAGVAVLGMLL